MNTPISRVRTDLVELLFWVLIGLLFFSLLGVVTAQFLYDVPLLQDPQALFSDTPSARRALILSQSLTSIGIFAFPAIMWSWRRSGVRPELALDKALSGRLVSQGILLMIVAIPMLNALIYFCNSLHYPSWLQWWIDAGERNTGLLELFLDMNGFGDLAVNLFVMAILPALGEEMLFRGVIQPSLARRMNIHLAIWISALLFGLMHQNLVNLIPLTLLGGILGYLRYWSGSLWLPILAHYTNNSLLLIVTFILQRNGIGEEAVNQVGTPESGFFMAVISALLVGFNLWLIKNSSRAA